jgi:rod shape-determining protein MreC
MGTNGPRPRLMHWPEDVPPIEGERVVTSAEANAFPAGLPLGVVRYNVANAPEVELAARLDRLDAIRLFDYGLRSVPPPETTVHTAERRGK